MKQTDTAAPRRRLIPPRAVPAVKVLAALLSLAFASCAALAPAVPESAPPETAPGKPDAPAAGQIPETAPGGAAPERPTPPEYIMGTGQTPADALMRFLGANNPGAGRDFIRSLADCYVEEAAAEGVNHDVAFAQMCLETGFLHYGGLVTPDMNNFCGLGSIGPGQPGLAFPDIRTGVRAHIQHLKAYASKESLNGELVDPRFRFVRRGAAPAILGLAGTWAADRSYGEKIRIILKRLYVFSFR